MPRMNMVIQNTSLPRISVRPAGSYNAQVNQGQRQVSTLMSMAFKAPMIDRIAGLKPGCSSCGKH
jgi:hypothetical protein